MVYGQAQQDQSKLIPYVIRCLLKGEPPRISNGQRMVDWVHVSDVADGMLRLAGRPVAVGRIVDIGTGRLISTVDLVRMICRLTRPEISPAIGAIPDRPMEPTGAADVEETRRLIDWTANVRLEDGLRQTIEWFSKNMDSKGI
jgi:nucleoside-diphosphate-sugar epimerase